jgi:hypothetical protein
MDKQKFFARKSQKGAILCLLYNLVFFHKKCEDQYIVFKEHQFVPITAKEPYFKNLFKGAEEVLPAAEFSLAFRPVNHEKSWQHCSFTLVSLPHTRQVRTELTVVPFSLSNTCTRRGIIL